MCFAAAIGGLGVEIDRILRIAERGVEIGGIGKAAAFGGDGVQLGGVSSHQDQSRLNDFALVDLQPSLLDQRPQAPP
jgi:hypothetical protein